MEYEGENGEDEEKVRKTIRRNKVEGHDVTEGKEYLKDKFFQL